MNATPVDCREWCHWCQGDYWKKRSAAERDNRPQFCECCGLSHEQSKRIYGMNLDVHHRTYERRNYELSADFEILCRRCHDIKHGRPAQVKKWINAPHPEPAEYSWLVRIEDWREWRALQRAECSRPHLLNPELGALAHVLAPLTAGKYLTKQQYKDDPRMKR